MKSKTKIIILIISGVIFAYSIQLYYFFTFSTDKSEKSLDKSSDINFDTKKFEISEILKRIHINNNWSAAKSAGIATGSGTDLNPYVIEDLVIDGNFSGYCIWIENSNYFLRIENCTLFNSGQVYFYDWSGGGGIVLSNVNNSLVINNNVSNNYRGILIENCSNNTLVGNIASNNDEDAIYIRESQNITLKGNIIRHQGLIISGSFKYDDQGLRISGLLQHFNSHNIDTTNLVNGKSLYYYANKNNLEPNNFKNAGQVILANCNNSYISNLNISQTNKALSIYFSNNNTITGNVVNNNTSDGIFISNSDNNVISKNNVRYNNDYGISLHTSANNNISRNNVNYNNLVGMRLFGLYQGSLVQGNNASYNLGVGIELNTGFNNFILENNISYNGYSGLDIKSCTDNKILKNTITNNKDFGIDLWSSDTNDISGNFITFNEGFGIYMSGSKYNTISGNIINNNEIGIYLERSCYNNVGGNTFMNNKVADYSESPDNSCEEKDLILGYNQFFLLDIFILISLTFIGILSIELIARRKKPIEEKREMLSNFRIKEKSTHIASKTEIKTKPLIVNQEKILQGKTLQVYWYILTHNGAGVREIQKSLNISSPGTVSYQINKLVQAGIISKDDKDGKYYVNEGIKKGILGFYIRIGYFMIPRFSLYLIINILGFIGYLFLASIYGDTFITNPGSILLLIFLIFGTIVFIFESIKIWKRKPTKLN